MNWKSILTIMTAVFLTACTESEAPTENESTERPSVTEENTESPTDDEVNIMLPSEELQKKAEGDAVLQLQEALQQIGYTIPQDGIFSDSTTWAITDFQLQADGLDATGVFDEKTKEALERFLEDSGTIEAGAGLPPLAEPVFTDAGSEVIANPYDQLAVINKHAALPGDYEPHDLVVPNVRFPFPEDSPKKQLRTPAARALEQLFDAAEEAGHILFAQSGYRSYDTQVSLFERYAEEHGEEAANLFSARPGESEHQSGLAMDITSEAVGYQLTVDFGDTPEGKWIADNAHLFGFIIRYPEGKEAITQYQYEPWHLRYVGVRAATEMKEKDWTLEEYFDE